MKLLAYLCASEQDELLRRLTGEATLNERQEQVLSPLLSLATQAAASASTTSAPIAWHLDVLGQFNETAQTSLGNSLRLHAGGKIPLSIPDDPVAGPITLLLRDVYPLMLLPTDPTFHGRLSLTSSLWRSPHRTAFEEAILRDPDLSRLFVVQDDQSGWSSSITRSTGGGGWAQLSLLADLVLTNAWSRAQAAAHDDIVSAGDRLLTVLHLIRGAARGEKCEVPVLVAFTGIVLDGVDEIKLPFGSLRPIADHERVLAPPSLEGRVSHTITEGDTVVASYAGDVLLETTMEYRLQIEAPRTDTGPTWPSHLRDYERLEANLATIRLGALLAGTSEAPLILLPTWRMTFDPLNWGPMLQWSDPRNGPAIAPRRLPVAVAHDFASLTTAIHTQRRPGFDVAVRRTISAMTTRGDQVDALIDLVIAWENLFGSSRGELGLRISAAIAWLLGSTPRERRGYRDEAVRIYDIRSAIVHGRVCKPSEVEAALSNARRMTLDVLRQLVSQRPEILAMKDGNLRSRDLIMGS